MKTRRKPRRKSRQYRSKAAFRVAGLEPNDAQSNGVTGSPGEIETLIRKISQLPKEQRQALEVYIDGLLSGRKR